MGVCLLCGRARRTPGECCDVASEVIEFDRLRLAVMLSWLWLVGG